MKEVIKLLNSLNISTSIKHFSFQLELTIQQIQSSNEEECETYEEIKDTIDILFDKEENFEKLINVLNYIEYWD